MSYADRKRLYERLITVYGRKPVLEILRDPALQVRRLHLAHSNRRDATITELEELARARGIEIHSHSREALARISRNGRQDQGVAADLDCPSHRDYRELLSAAPAQPLRLLALDQVTNPQNLGMIIRTLCASPLDGLLLPRRGCAPLSPLVIKASAGTLFHCPLWRCETLPEALRELGAAGTEIAVLAADAEQPLSTFQPSGSVVYVLGNETHGISAQISALARHRLSIPLARGVESLNVAVTAGLVAFRTPPPTPASGPRASKPPGYRHRAAPGPAAPRRRRPPRR
ncbi:MAG: 23S rRNA (guanosine(2251)-2'-O)-methyltransferase RlmB [Porticoccaceae bacterium]|nr:23S rRNA (guanosine(2251)-2'-O)-methyltransferase RlmB [Porticoccaceae bacterium]